MPERQAEESIQQQPEQQSRLRRFGEFMLKPRAMWPVAALIGNAIGSIPEMIHPDTFERAHVSTFIIATTVETVSVWVAGVLRERAREAQLVPIAVEAPHFDH